MKRFKWSIVLMVTTAIIFSGCNQEVSKADSNISTLASEKEHYKDVLLPDEIQLLDEKIERYGGGDGTEKLDYEIRIEEHVEKIIQERKAFKSMKKGYQKLNGTVIYDDMYYTFYNSIIYKSEIEFDRNDIQGCGAVEVYRDFKGGDENGYVPFAIVDDQFVYGNYHSILFIPIGEQEPVKVLNTIRSIKGVYSFENGLLYNGSDGIFTVDLASIFVDEFKIEDRYPTSENIEANIGKTFGSIKVRENQLIFSGDINRPDLIDGYSWDIFEIKDMDYLVESTVIKDGEHQVLIDLVMVDLNEFEIRKLIENIPVVIKNIPKPNSENKILVSGATSYSILTREDEPIDTGVAKVGYYKEKESYAHGYIVDLNTFEAEEYELDSEKIIGIANDSKNIYYAKLLDNESMFRVFKVNENGDDTPITKEHPRDDFNELYSGDGKACLNFKNSYLYYNPIEEKWSEL